MLVEGFFCRMGCRMSSELPRASGPGPSTAGCEQLCARGGKVHFNPGAEGQVAVLAPGFASTR